jgi:hypothetical protein
MVEKQNGVSMVNFSPLDSGGNFAKQTQTKSHNVRIYRALAYGQPNYDVRHVFMCLSSTCY